MAARLASIALITSTLAGCSKMAGWTGAYTPDTPHNRLYSGFANPGCAKNSIPQFVDTVLGVLFVLPVAAVAGGGVANGETVREAADPISLLLVPAALFLISALEGRSALASCRSLTLHSDAEQAVAAARAGDCSTVETLGPQIKELDPDYYKTVFVGDAAVSRCLPPDGPRFFCTISPDLTALCFCSQVEAECVERQHSITAVGANMNNCVTSSTDTCKPASSPSPAASNLPSAAPLVDAGVAADGPDAGR